MSRCSGRRHCSLRLPDVKVALLNHLELVQPYHLFQLLMNYMKKRKKYVEISVIISG